MKTGSVTVIVRTAEDGATQVEADVRFYHQDAPNLLATRFRTHGPKGAFLQIGWPIGRYRYVAEAEGYETREGCFDLEPGPNSWLIYLAPKEARDA